MSDKTNAGRNSTEVTDFNLYTSVPPVFITQERLRERARRADENKSTPHLREDGEQLRAHAAALEEIERLKVEKQEIAIDALDLMSRAGRCVGNANTKRKCREISERLEAQEPLCALLSRKGEV